MLSDRCATFNLEDFFSLRLEEINFGEIYFRANLVLLCKFWHISRRFIFADGEILIILCGPIFAVIKHALNKFIFTKMYFYDIIFPRCIFIMRAIS